MLSLLSNLCKAHTDPLSDEKNAVTAGPSSAADSCITQLGIFFGPDALLGSSSLRSFITPSSPKFKSANVEYDEPLRVVM